MLYQETSPLLHDEWSERAGAHSVSSTTAHDCTGGSSLTGRFKWDRVARTSDHVMRNPSPIYSYDVGNVNVICSGR
jgi:hypothetical protein